MGLRINTNVTALTNHKNLVINDEKLSGSLERLSSGLRINRAADDAAGLTVSEKLRTQVRGLNRAIMNTQDGISLIQTAEGALNEVQSMLHRMRELALQSSNDTLTSTDRLEIQKEINQLKEDINRISYGTEFNTKKLLDGSGTAIISSSDPTGIDGVVTGEVATFSDFSIVVLPTSEKGGAQLQRSNIFTKTNGSIADGNTTLQSIANFYDNLGNFLLEEPSTLYVQGDNHNTTFVISKDLKLSDLASRMQAAMTTDQLGDGLHFDGSTATVKTSGENNGQIEVISGKVGRIGRITFTGEEGLVKALGFQEVVPAVDPVYSIAVTNTGPEAIARKTVNTKIAGNRAAGLIQGLDLVFTPPTNAFTNTMTGELGVSVSYNINFTLDDNVPAGGAGTGFANISITGGGAYAMKDLVASINEQISLADPNMRVKARINDAYAIEFYTLNTGSAAWVSISNTTYNGVPGVANPLGIANGRFTGTNGIAGGLKGTNTLPSYNVATVGVTDAAFSITDRHGNSVSIYLGGNYTAGGMASLVEAINLQMGSMQVRAYDAGGILSISSLETGVDSNFTISDNSGLNGGVAGAVSIFSALQIVGGTTTSTGFDGMPASQNFAYDQMAAFYGINIAEDPNNLVPDNLSLFFADETGKGAYLSFDSGDASIGLAFHSMTSIANIINSVMDANAVNLASDVLSNNSIKIYAKTPG